MTCPTDFKGYEEGWMTTTYHTKAAGRGCEEEGGCSAGARPVDLGQGSGGDVHRIPSGWVHSINFLLV